jgi:hypothetical protein
VARKEPGKEARLSYAGHVQMDNRHGLVVDTRLTQVSGTAEPEAALAIAAQIAGRRRVTLDADKGYDQKELVRELPAQQVTPHISQVKRKRVEEIILYCGAGSDLETGLQRTEISATQSAPSETLRNTRKKIPPRSRVIVL